MIRLAFSGDRLIDQHIELERGDRHYLTRVMRVAPGDALEVMIEGMGLFHARVDETASNLLIERQLLAAAAAPDLAITLAPALIKHDLLAQVVEKGTEVGVFAFEAWVSERSIVRSVSASKWDRWQKIAKEATEQCRRKEIPQILEVKPNAGCLTLSEDQLGIVWDPRGIPLMEWWRKAHRPKAVKTVSGPEGGLSPQEYALLIRRGFVGVCLGPQIFRAENAGVFGALLLHFLSREGPESTSMIGRDC
jgi:16S rRNA (uracil1498-N3)-methyltransferase